MDTENFNDGLQLINTVPNRVDLEDFPSIVYYKMIFL